MHTRPFGLRDKLGYLLGNMANDFTFLFAGIFLMVFYTKVLAIPAGLVGTLFLVARILDAFTDVTMGAIADRMPRTREGKFRPWLLRMCLPVSFSSFLLYQSALADAAMPLRIAYMFVTYILWSSICYTAINIPYGSMASLISPDADDRASLSAARSVGSVLVNLLVGIGAPAILYAADANGNQIVRGSRFPRVALALSLASLVCYLLAYALTTERVEPAPRERSRLGFRKTVGTLVSDRALIGIVLASVFILAAQLLGQSINQYLFIDYFGNRSGVMIMSAAGILPGLLLAPFAVPLVRRFGKKEIGIFASVLGSAASFLLFLIKTESMWLYILLSVIGFLGFTVFNLVMWATVTDVIDDRELRLSRREDGTVYAVYSFARKVGQAIAGGLSGWSLAWIGFDESAKLQSEAVAKGIYRISTLFPAVLYLAVALSLILLYPLGRERVRKNAARLAEKRKMNTSERSHESNA